MSAIARVAMHRSALACSAAWRDMTTRAARRALLHVADALRLRVRQPFAQRTPSRTADAFRAHTRQSFARCAPFRPRARRAFALCAALLLGALACQAPTLSGQRHAPRAPVQKVAVAPLSLSARLAKAPAASASLTTPRVAAQLVARQLAEALALRDVEVVAPSDVAHALANAKDAARADDPRALAQLVAREFGADALLIGELTRWTERVGGEFGASRGAAVGFRVALRRAPGASLLWSLEFDESQKPAGQNVLVTRSYPGGGLRWVSAEEWARWSAGRVARAIPLH